MNRLLSSRRHIAAGAIAAFVSVVSVPALADQPALRSEGWLVNSYAEIAAPPFPAGSDAQKKSAAAPSAADLARLRWWAVGGPAHRWNEIIIEELQDQFVTLPLAGRHLALFHAALDDAIAASRHHRKTGLQPSQHAAAATVAADILSHLFPERTGVFAAKAEEAIRVRLAGGAESAAEAAAGRAIGAQVAALAIARAKTDGTDAKWTGQVPDGAGLWKSANPNPIAPAAGGWKPWLLAHPSEVRPAAPPVLGSERFRADMAELKAFQRTPKSNHRATYWEVFGGARAHSLWNEIARTRLLEQNASAEFAARTLAAMNIAFADAGIACWEAKYVYWYPRPAQADPDFKSVFPAPNHPSYPSAHSCFSTAASTVLAALLPQERERLLAVGKEASEARLWAGIHYRFDIEAGQEIGRKVAEKALARSFAARMN